MACVIYFFLLNLIIIVIKILKKNLSNPWVQQPMWVGLDLFDGLDCVEFF